MRGIYWPPSDEGGGFCEAKDGGRERVFVRKSQRNYAKNFLSLTAYGGAPSSEGAQDDKSQ